MALDEEQWPTIVQQYDVRQATLGFGWSPVGFAVGGQNHRGYYLVRLAVLPQHRRIGIGTLLTSAIVVAAKRYYHEKIFLDTFESSICPGQPGDVSAFLKSCGFRATTVNKNQFMDMGERVNGVTWELDII
jgi:ribosomal protein S18 acetylase RimI-like enzyme